MRTGGCDGRRTARCVDQRGQRAQQRRSRGHGRASQHRSPGGGRAQAIGAERLRSRTRPCAAAGWTGPSHRASGSQFAPREGWRRPSANVHPHHAAARARPVARYGRLASRSRRAVRSNVDVEVHARECICVRELSVAAADRQPDYARSVFSRRSRRRCARRQVARSEAQPANELAGVDQLGEQLAHGGDRGSCGTDRGRARRRRPDRRATRARRPVTRELGACGGACSYKRTSTIVAWLDVWCSVMLHK